MRRLTCPVKQTEYPPRAVASCTGSTRIGCGASLARAAVAAARRDDHRRQPPVGAAARARDRGARSPGRRREDARVPRAGATTSASPSPPCTCSPPTTSPTATPTSSHALFEIIADLADDLSHFRDWRVQHVGTTDGLPDSLVAMLARGREAHRGQQGPARQPRRRLRRSRGDHGCRCAASSQRTTQSRAARSTPSPSCSRPTLIGEHLYTGGQPDPDLVIRTSGEQRLSDFMLWQSAHSEFYFVEALGPDLREVDFLRAAARLLAAAAAVRRLTRGLW